MSQTTSPIATPETIRNSTRLRRRMLSQEDQINASELLLQQLIHLSEITQANNIAIYLSNDGELDTTLFIDWCWQHGIKTYLPVIHPFSKGHLLFLHYHQLSIMKANQYRILEPTLNVLDIIQVQELDIIFTPLVAFDAKGNRMGMGGGFYDRTLAKWYQHFKQGGDTKPQPIGIAHDCQQVEHIPSQVWDIPLPKIITPTQHFQFNLNE